MGNHFHVLVPEMWLAGDLSVVLDRAYLKSQVRDKG